MKSKNTSCYFQHKFSPYVSAFRLMVIHRCYHSLVKRKTYKMKCFVIRVNSFLKTLHLKYLTEFWIRLRNLDALFFLLKQRGKAKLGLKPLNVTHIQVGGRCKKALVISFSPVTSSSVEISFHNFLIFSFDRFGTMLLIVEVIPSTCPECLKLNKDQPSKNMAKFIQNWNYDNFSQRNASVTKLWSHDPLYNIISVTW